MFTDCINLTNINLSSFDTSKVKWLNGMFNNCNNLTILDLSNFNTSNVIHMGNMFTDCEKLTTIFASEQFTTISISSLYSSSAIFNNTPKLVGWNGTVWDSNYTDKERAKIDKPGQEGYFTDKNASSLTAECGNADGTPTANTPTSNLCNKGQASAVTTGDATFSRTCTNNTVTANCSASRKFYINFHTHGWQIEWPETQLFTYWENVIFPEVHYTWYIFSGWYDNSLEYNGQLVTSRTVRDNKQFHAYWKLENTTYDIPVNWSCSTEKDKCIAWTFQDVTDSSTQYKWKCVWSNWWTSADCTKDIPQVVNWSCSSVKDTCLAWTFQDVTDSSTQYKWKCVWSNWWTSADCTKNIPVNW